MEFNMILILAVIVIVSAYPGSAAPSIATFQEVAEVNKEEGVGQQMQSAAAPTDVNASNLKARTGRYYPYYHQPYYGGGYGGGAAAASASASASSVGGGYGGIYG